MSTPVPSSHAVETLPLARGDFFAGFWRLADPKISLASVASMLVGASAAAREGPLHWGWLGLTVLGIFAIEVAKNASGEIFDFDSGTDLSVAPADRSPFSGGKRVLVDGLLTRRQTVGISLVAYLIGAVVGLWIVAGRDVRVLGLGMVGMACAYFYHAPPFQLAYRGLGELAVGLCYGPLIAVGTYLVQRGWPGSSVWGPALPLGLVIAGFLWINEFPDYEADRSTGKRTLVVRLGRAAASRWFGYLLALAYGGLAIAPLAGAPFGVWGGFLGALPAWRAARALRLCPTETARIIPAQAQTLASFVLLALGVALGYVMGAR